MRSLTFQGWTQLVISAVAIFFGAKFVAGVFLAMGVAHLFAADVIRAAKED